RVRNSLMALAPTSRHDRSVQATPSAGASAFRTQDEFAFMPALEMRRLIQAKQVSPVEIAEHTLRRIEESQSVLNAFVTITPELALAAARKPEKAIMSREDRGLLTGIPLSIKALTAVKGVRFT